MFISGRREKSIDYHYEPNNGISIFFFLKLYFASYKWRNLYDVRMTTLGLKKSTRFSMTRSTICNEEEIVQTCICRHPVFMNVLWGPSVLELVVRDISEHTKCNGITMNAHKLYAPYYISKEQLGSFKSALDCLYIWNVIYPLTWMSRHSKNHSGCCSTSFPFSIRH